MVDANGEIISQSRYLPFGEVLWEDGASPTDYTYTGQRSLSDIGLMDYNARFYDPLLGRFTSPDSIIPDPGSVIGYNRFAYVNNNPVRYNDPSGHYIPFDACMATNMNYGSCAAVYGPKFTNGSEWGSHGIGTIGLQVPVVAGDEDHIEGYYSPGEYKGSTFYEYNLEGYKWYEEDDLAEVYYRITIHHEGDDQTYDVLRVQENEMNSGFYDIGYHYIIGQDGTIYVGRDIRARGNHAYPNTGNIGILLIGDFNPGYDIADPYDRHGQKDDDDYLTQAQVDSAITIVSWLDSVYGIEEVVGHSEINDTACPGANAMPLVDLLRGLLP